MANTTAAELHETVKTLKENLDHMFLLVFGCIIFCEYVFLSL